MTIIPPTGADFRASLQAHWKMFVIEGIVLLVLGLLALLVPPLLLSASRSFLDGCSSSAAPWG